MKEPRDLLEGYVAGYNRYLKDNAGNYLAACKDATWVKPMTFDDAGPVAQAILVYGQSTDPRSPHYADQLPLYSRKEWPSLPFKEAGINADPTRKTTTLTE